MRRSLLIAALLVCSSRANASNEDDFFVGDHAAMTGGAVVATVADGVHELALHVGSGLHF